MFTLKPMLGPATIAALLAYLLYPAVLFIEKKFRLSHRTAVPLVYFLILSLIVITVTSFAPILGRQAQSLTRRLQEALPEVESLLMEPAQAWGVEESLSSFLDEIQSTTRQVFDAQRVFKIINSASTNLAWLFLILAMTYYLLLDWPRLRDWIYRQFPQEYRMDIVTLHAGIRALWQAYLRGQLLVITLLGLISGIGAFLIGLPKAILLGFIAAFLAIIPSLGPFITLIIAVIIAWFEGSTYLPISNALFVLLTIAVFSGVQFLEGAWFQPQIMGQRLKIHPGVVIFAVVGALTLGSALLALIIVPFLASVSIIFRYMRDKVYGVDPWIPEASDDTE